MPITYKDPIHGIIEIPDEFRRVIESPALARLRNVRQLGFTLASYPGAVHTRFEHTIGTVAVLTSLMDQLGNKDEELRRNYILAALLSEIGIYPLSYSSRPVFRKYGMDKKKYAREIYKNYLHPVLALSESEEKFIFDPMERSGDWYSPISDIDSYVEYLDPIKLASTIDYVLRDCYFTGLFVGGFDYRYFTSLWDSNRNLREYELLEMLQILHRSIHMLNKIYGDPRRRVLSILLYKLVDYLHERNELDFSNLKQGVKLIELDDEKFLFDIGQAVEKSSLTGDHIGKRLYYAITQREVIDEHNIDPSELSLEIENSTEELRKTISNHLEWDEHLTILYSTDHDDTIGFRMFGTEFSNFKEALQSKQYSIYTGLDLSEYKKNQSSKLKVFLV